jgi:hypothetical protein
MEELRQAPQPGGANPGAGLNGTFQRACHAALPLSDFIVKQGAKFRVSIFVDFVVFTLQ